MPQRTAYVAPSIPDTASDGGVRQEKLIPAPIQGLMEGVDPSTLGYPDTVAPVLQNIRVSRQTWLTRLGQVLQYTAPLGGTAVPRILAYLYQSSGAFTWLLAVGSGTGATLYEIKLGTDTGWVAASGGTGLGGSSQPYFQGTTLADKLYLTDRQNTLYKYLPTGSPNHLSPLTLPAAPASGPTCVPRPFAILENYNTAWTASSPGNFSQDSDTAANPPPDGGVSAKFDCTGTGGLGQNAKSTDFSFPTPQGTYVGGISHSMAFWLKRDKASFTGSVGLQLQYGVTAPTDYTTALNSDVETQNTWYPFFVPIGDMAALNYLRLYVQSSSGGGQGDYWLSDIYLPGTLEGPYQWLYTYYDSAGNRESAPSPVSNNGQPLDFSMAGASFDQTTAAAFRKACLIIPTLSGDASVTTIRIYRNGGVPSLTVDANGLPLWLFVDSVPNFSTTVNQIGGITAGDTSVVLTSVTGLAVGNWLVFDPGNTSAQEAVQITAINTGSKTVSITGGLNLGLGAAPPNSFAFAHANGATVRACYVDNTPNEAIQLLNALEVPIVTGEVVRSAPPAAARYVQRSPDGRLWLFNYSGHPNGIAVSNAATPFRTTDYETFTVGVDPVTRNSPTMGWNFDIFLSVAQDEEIEWGGFFLGWPTVITRGHVYRITAHSQSEWGPTSVQAVLNTGCLPGAGDTVREVDGVLYWVAPGPKVMSWDGQSQPFDISWLRCNVRLKAAPSANWQNWYATVHRRQEGRYYCLYFAGAASGATGCDQRLDYNIDHDAWEPCVYAAPTGGTQSFAGAFAVDVPGQSVDGLYQVDTTGNTYHAETGTTDGALPIPIQFATAKLPLYVFHQIWFRWLDESLVHSVKLRLPAAADAVTLTVATDHGEYPPAAHSYPLNLAGNEPNVQNPASAAIAATVVEIQQRADRDLFGRACQLTVAGSVSNQPEFQLLTLTYIPIRHGRVSG